MNWNESWPLVVLCYIEEVNNNVKQYIFQKGKSLKDSTFKTKHDWYYYDFIKHKNIWYRIWKIDPSIKQDKAKERIEMKA